MGNVLLNLNRANISSGCDFNNSDGPTFVFIEVWTFDNGFRKVGQTITKTNSDFISSNGEINLEVNVPKEGTYYLELEIITGCSFCCGETNNLNPLRCFDRQKGKQHWKKKTDPGTWKPNAIVWLDFNGCRCECL